jgi:hypothetical protein
MRGTTAECLEDFFQRFPARDHIELLAEFARVTPLTVERWKHNGNTPEGEAAIRLRTFLDALGYEVDELSELQPPARQMLHLIGYGAYEVDDVKDKLGYNNTQALHRVLVHAGAPAKTQAYRLQMIARDSDEELAQARQQWDERLAPLRTVVLGNESVGTSQSPGVGLSPLPASQPLLAAAATTPPTPRRRERPRHTPETNREDPSDYATALHHVILAFDNLVAGSADSQLLARLMKERISPKRLRAVQAFLRQTLRE